MSTDLVRREEDTREPSVMEIIQSAINTPGLDESRMAVIERLIALKERSDDQSRRNAYAAAMSRLQSKLPQIDRRGKIVVGTQERSRYARMEDLDAQIRPFLAEEGFAFSFDSAPGQNGDIRFIGKLSHRDGHSELKQIDMPVDNGGAKSKVQERGSTLSYAIRQLLRMHLNLVMRDEDNDGTGDPQTLSPREVDELKSMFAQAFPQPKTEETRFLKWMHVEKWEDILRRDVGKATNFLRGKIAEAKK